jgi:Leucine-rich repeat (LRR) protein
VAERQTSSEAVPLQPTKRALRSYLRFSLRTLIVVVLLAGGMLGRIVHRAHVQRDTVAAIKRAGGTVHYDWEMKSDGSFRTSSQPWAPKWLVDGVGMDYFGHVHRVDLLNQGSDGDLVTIGRLSGLWNLNLDGSQATDAGLANLKGLTDLERLYLPITNVGDAGLLDLKHLTHLTELHVSGTRISDGGLKHLRGMTNLKEVILQGTQVSDAGVQELQQALPQLVIRR